MCWKKIFKKSEGECCHRTSLMIPVVILSLLVGLAGGIIGGAVSSSLVTEDLPLFSSLVSGTQVTDKNNQDKYQPVRGSGEETVIAAVNKVKPAVVSIIVSKEVSARSSYDPFFDFPGFFNFELPPQSNSNDGQGEKREVGGGTGFIISSDGLIITNKHVVADSAAEYTIVLADGKTKYPAKVLAMDPFNDFAVVKIEVKDLPTATLGDSDKLQVGQQVIAIGNALSEYQNTVTSGIISGVGRQVTAGGGLGAPETLRNVIQTDAAINPGNSGGPLVNLRGEVIGINTAMAGSAQSIGFAIPINEVKKAVESVKTKGKIVRAYIGIRYVLVNKDIAEKNNLKVDYGALILRGQTPAELAIIPGSPADKAGLVENDIVLEVDGKKVDADNDLARLVGGKNPGDEVTLKVSHKGEEKEVKVKLEEYMGK